MKTAIGASLPVDLFLEFTVRANSFPGGKTGLQKEALRAYFDANPMPDHLAKELEELKAKENIA